MAKTRKIPAEAAAYIARLMGERLTEKYGPKGPDGRRAVGQRQIVEETGISQPVLADVENGTGSVGVHTLIAIRNFLGKYTIDDLLRLDPLPGAELERTLQKAVEAALDARDARRGGSTPPASSPPATPGSSPPGGAKAPRRRAP